MNEGESQPGHPAHFYATVTLGRPQAEYDHLYSHMRANSVRFRLQTRDVSRPCRRSSLDTIAEHGEGEEDAPSTSSAIAPTTAPVSANGRSSAPTAPTGFSPCGPRCAGVLGGYSSHTASGFISRVRVLGCSVIIQCAAYMYLAASRKPRGGRT